MEQQKAIEVSVRINLLDLNQVNAYHNLLLAIGGHELPIYGGDNVYPTKAREVFIDGSIKLESAQKENGPHAEAATYEHVLSATKIETPKRTRGKKETEPVPTEPVPTEPVPTEPVPTEPVPTEPAPTESEAPVIEKADTLDVDTFRSKVVLVTMSSSEGMARKDQIKAHLKAQYGEFNAERLTGEQRTEAFNWMRETFTDVNFD